MRLSDPFNIRTWQYTAVGPDGHRTGPMLINENLTGAALGTQRPARMCFRTAMWLVHGWNQIGTIKYHLVIPTTRN